MSANQAIRAAYTFGAEHGLCFVFVTRDQNGCHDWNHANEPASLEPGSTSEIVWSRSFIQPFDIGEPTEEEWSQWCEVNAESVA